MVELSLGGRIFFALVAIVLLTVAGATVASFVHERNQCEEAGGVVVGRDSICFQKDAIVDGENHG